MSHSSKEDRETYSSDVTKKKEERAYIRIEYLEDNTVPIISANLCEACSHDAVYGSTLARQFKQFQEG